MDGKPVYGFANAARVYFGKPFQRLTEDEYIALVAMVMAPDSFSVKKHPDANADRVSWIKLLISGKYTPKSLMALYYGGKYAPQGFFKRLIWVIKLRRHDVDWIRILGMLTAFTFHIETLEPLNSTTITTRWTIDFSQLENMDSDAMQSERHISQYAAAGK